MSVTFQLPRSIRRSDYDALPGQSVFGPAPWLAFDAEDVVVRRRTVGAKRWVTVTGGFTVSLSAAQAGFPTVSFAYGQDGMQVRLEGRRVHPRITDVTRAGSLQTALLERELDAQASVLQELRRDIGDVLSQAVLVAEGQASPMLDVDAFKGKLVGVDGGGDFAPIEPNQMPDVVLTSSIIDSTAAGRSMLKAANFMAAAALLPTVITFDTLADLAAAVVPVTVPRVVVFGRAAAGDGGYFSATRYVGAPGAHPGLFPSNAGAVTWELDIPADRTIDPTVFNFKASATANVQALHDARDFLSIKGGGAVMLPGRSSELWPVDSTIVWNKPFVSLLSPGVSTNHNGGGGQRWSAGLIYTGPYGGTMLSVAPDEGPTAQILAGVKIEAYLNGNLLAHIGADIRSCRVCDFDLFFTKFNVEACSIGVVNELAANEARDTQKCNFKLRFRQIHNANPALGEGNGVGLHTWGDTGANVSYNTFDIEGIHTDNHGCQFQSFDCNDVVWFRVHRPVGAGISALFMAGASALLVPRSNVFSGKYFAQGGTLIQGTEGGAAIPYGNRAVEVDWENNQPEPTYGVGVPETAFEWRTERGMFRLGSVGCAPLPNGYLMLWGAGNIGANAAATINLPLPNAVSLEGPPVWGMASLNGVDTTATSAPRINLLSATQVQIVNTDGAPQFCSFFAIGKTKWTL